MLLLNVQPRRPPAAAAPRPRAMTREELHRRMATQADCFGLLVRFTHPFEEPDGYRTDPAEVRLLGKIRKWAGNPRKHPTFGRALSEKIRRHAREELPFPGACLVASGRQQERMGNPPVRHWRGAALDCLAVLAQSSSNVWMRDKEPQMERIAVTGGHGLLRAVTLLLPADFADSHLSPPMEAEQS